jgi:peptidoglycan/LPS O-acetylase OafA/YrhL
MADSNVKELSTVGRVNELDLLRFFAAMMVVLFHYSFRGYASKGISPMPYPLLAPAAKYGYLGVDLFFLISGFVILMTASSGSLRKFVISRIVRLYPAFWAACTLTFLTIAAIGGGRYSASLSQYFINLTMLNGFVGVDPLDGVYWTLLVEMKFYALVALTLIFGKIKHAQELLIFWLLATVALDIFPIDNLRNLLIVDYAPFFIAGAASFLIWSRGLSLTRLAVIVVAWSVALAHSLQAIPDFEREFNTTYSGAAVLGIISVFFAILFLVSTRRTGRLGKRKWVTVGALTYPLYLIHQYIGFMIFHIAYPAVNSHVLLWSTVLLMLGAAYLINVSIEQRYSTLLKNALNRALDSCRALSLSFSEHAKGGGVQAGTSGVTAQDSAMPALKTAQEILPPLLESAASPAPDETSESPYRSETR